MPPRSSRRAKKKPSAHANTRDATTTITPTAAETQLDTAGEDQAAANTVAINCTAVKLLTSESADTTVNRDDSESATVTCSERQRCSNEPNYNEDTIVKRKPPWSLTVQRTQTSQLQKDAYVDTDHFQRHRDDGYRQYGKKEGSNNHERRCDSSIAVSGVDARCEAGGGHVRRDYSTDSSTQVPVPPMTSELDFSQVVPSRLYGNCYRGRPRDTPAVAKRSVMNPTPVVYRKQYQTPEPSECATRPRENRVSEYALYNTARGRHIFPSGSDVMEPLTSANSTAFPNVGKQAPHYNYDYASPSDQLQYNYDYASPSDQLQYNYDYASPSDHQLYMSQCDIQHSPSQRTSFKPNAFPQRRQVTARNTRAVPRTPPELLRGVHGSVASVVPTNYASSATSTTAEAVEALKSWLGPASRMGSAPGPGSRMHSGLGSGSRPSSGAESVPVYGVCAQPCVVVSRDHKEGGSRACDQFQGFTERGGGRVTKQQRYRGGRPHVSGQVPPPGRGTAVCENISTGSITSKFVTNRRGSSAAVLRGCSEYRNTDSNANVHHTKSIAPRPARTRRGRGQGNFRGLPATKTMCAWEEPPPPRHMERTEDCPLCFDAIRGPDLHFYPCPCGYQVCFWCLHQIRSQHNGLCPACRQAYQDKNFRLPPDSAEATSQNEGGVPRGGHDAMRYNSGMRVAGQPHDKHRGIRAYSTRRGRPSGAGQHCRQTNIGYDCESKCERTC